MSTWLPLLYDLSLLRPLGQQPDGRVKTRSRAPYHLQPLLASQHRCSYGISLGAQSRAPWSDRAMLATRSRAPWADRPMARTQHRARYGISLAAQHRALWSDPSPAATQHRALWHLLQDAHAQHRAPYSLRTTDPARAQHRAPWLHLSAALIQSVANTPELLHAGRSLALQAASVSADESNAHWLANLQVAQAADYAGLHIGSAVTLRLPLGDFAFVVDGLSVQRTAPGQVGYSVSAISPLALQDAPYAAPIDYARSSATLASTVVAELLGPLTWQMPDWAVPAAALQITQATPLAAARAIVGAAGGLVESMPDGSVVCRMRHPVSPPSYSLALCSHTFDDDAVLQQTAQLAPLRGYNRVQVANSTDTDSAASADVLEYVPDDGSDTAGTVRARLASPRPVLLVHSGHPGTVIAAQGSVTRTETELVEFVAGQGSLGYPADAITACAWQHVDLGAPTITAGDTSALSTPTPGYSLARISYRTTALQWRVQLASPAEVVQFILIDA